MKWLFGQKLHLENGLSMRAGVYNRASSPKVLKNFYCTNKHSHKDDSGKREKTINECQIESIKRKRSSLLRTLARSH